MPAAMRAPGGEFSDDPPPEGVPVAMGVLRNGPIDSDDDEPSQTSRKPPQGDLLTGEGGAPLDEPSRVSTVPPMLPRIDTGNGIGFPSRAPSSKSGPSVHGQRPNPQHPEFELEVPDIPRKSSKRHSGADFPTPSFNVVSPTSPARVGPQASPVSARNPSQHAATSRLPFQRSDSQRRQSGSSMGVTDESTQEPSTSPSPDERPTSFGHVPQHSIYRVDPAQQYDLDLLGASAELVDERGPSSRSSREGRTS